MDESFLPFLILIPIVVGVFFWMMWFGLIVAGLVFWIYMLIDVAKREFPKPDDKTAWILIVALMGIIGSAIYYFVVKRPAERLSQIPQKP